MPLHDHFHPPLSTYRHWHAFHNAWATYIAADLNHRLPAGYFAEPNVQFGIEIDVAAFEENRIQDSSLTDIGQEAWQAPPPKHSVPFEPTTETVEVDIFHAEAGPILRGVIELVSPANKDRDTHRETFVSKCEAYLQEGLGLVIVDVVTGRTANLHNELLARIAPSETALFAASLYTTAYRVVSHQEQSTIEIWSSILGIGEPLPTMPLWLRGDLCLPIQLNATYELTCREQRIETAL